MRLGPVSGGDDLSVPLSVGAVRMRINGSDRDN